MGVVLAWPVLAGHNHTHQTAPETSSRARPPSEPRDGRCGACEDYQTCRRRFWAQAILLEYLHFASPPIPGMVDGPMVHLGFSQVLRMCIRV